MQQRNPHESPSEVLVRLLQQWVDQAFPIPGSGMMGSGPQGRTDDDIRRLNDTWTKLSEALCGHQTAKRADFDRELANLRRTPRAGDPPVHALAHRLRELCEAGLRELFVVIAVRRALDDLVEANMPGNSADWHQLANGTLPTTLQFGYWGDDLPPPSSGLRAYP